MGSSVPKLVTDGEAGFIPSPEEHFAILSLLQKQMRMQPRNIGVWIASHGESLICAEFLNHCGALMFSNT